MLVTRELQPRKRHAALFHVCCVDDRIRRRDRRPTQANCVVGFIEGEAEIAGKDATVVEQVCVCRARYVSLVVFCRTKPSSPIVLRVETQ